jgi:di/tricarboxylate transporter
MKSPFILLLLVNAAIFLITVLVAKLINHLAKRDLIAPRSLGFIAVICFILLLIFLTFLSASSSISSSSSADSFAHGVAQGQLLGNAIFPGAIVILIAWLFTRKNSRNENITNGSKQSTTIKTEPSKKTPKSIGDKIATCIFWAFAGGLLLLAVIGQLAGS